MPCAMSSLRGASGVVGCDRVVCPLVLHATTIAHLDVLLCTLLCFLLCAVRLCGAVPLSCSVPCTLPALSCGVSAWCCGCGVWVRPAPALPAPVGVCYGVPLYPCAFPVFFLWIIPALYMGGCYMRALYVPCIRALFFGLLFMIRSVHAIKAGPWIPNVGFQKSA
jgi:hypothetical protein